MAPKPDDPGRTKSETLAWRCLDAAESNHSLIMRSHGWARDRRTHSAGAATVSNEHLAKLLANLVISQQPEREIEIDPAAFEPRDNPSGEAARSVFRGDSFHLQLSRSHAWVTTRPRRGRQGAFAGRYALTAVVVVVGSLTLLANMVNHPGLQPEHTLPVAEKSDAPVVAQSHPNDEELALASLPATIAAANSAPRTEAPPSIAAEPEEAKPVDPEAEPMHIAQGPVAPPADRQDMQSQLSQPSDQAAEASQRLDKLHGHVAKSETRTAAQPHHANVTDRPLIASSPARKPMPEPAWRGAREPRSVPQQLFLARAALANRDQRAARGLMEEAQTLITFQPANVSPRVTTAASSQVTEALIMLGHGDEAGALQCLNQVIAAIRQTS